MSILGTPKYKRGTENERKLVRYLVNRHFPVTVVDPDAPAPAKLHALQRDFTLPDVAVYDGYGNMCWLECKWQSTPLVEYRRTGEWRTSIDLRLWQDYQQVQARTDTPVLLVFASSHEGEVRFGPLSVGERGLAGSSGANQMWFTWRLLTLLCSYEEYWAERAPTPRLEDLLGPDAVRPVRGELFG